MRVCVYEFWGAHSEHDRIWAKLNNRRRQARVRSHLAHDEDGASMTQIHRLLCMCRQQGEWGAFGNGTVFMYVHEHRCYSIAHEREREHSMI